MQPARPRGNRPALSAQPEPETEIQKRNEEKREHANETINRPESRPHARLNS